MRPRWEDLSFFFFRNEERRAAQKNGEREEGVKRAFVKKGGGEGEFWVLPIEEDWRDARGGKEGRGGGKRRQRKGAGKRRGA